MCVYFWVDSDKEKSEEAIERIFEIIDDAFENPDPFILNRTNQLKKALSVRGQYDRGTRERLNALFSNTTLFRDELTRFKEKDRSLFKVEGMAGIGDIVPVHTDMDTIKMMRFGMVGYNNNTMFNARSEGIESKETWRGPVINSRCIIPASQYIESHTDMRTKRKTKYLFWLPGHKKIYMAGIWRHEESLFKRFAILTRQAVGEVEKLHDRMPVILGEDEADAWMKKGNEAFGNAVYEYAETKVEHARYDEAG